MATERARYRFMVDEYEQMGVAGILTEDDRVELLDGEIVEMAPIGIEHATSVDRLTEILVLAVVAAGGLTARVQNPIRLRNNGEPQPDLAVVYKRDYRATPTEADTLLVIEVADSTLTSDRAVKLPLYAAAGVPEAWLVDLNAGVYRQVAWARPGDALASTVVPSLLIPASGDGTGHNEQGRHDGLPFHPQPRRDCRSASYFSMGTRMTLPHSVHEPS